MENQAAVSNSCTIDAIYNIIKQKYYVKKIIINPLKNSKIAPQASLIHIALKREDNLKEIVDSYLLLHKMHNHLKNYILNKRKKYNGYKKEFIDMFLNIFIDNFLIIKELTKYIDNSCIHYMNIWFDGYFINHSNEILENPKKNYKKYQPALFFIILLYISLPDISSLFKDIPFTSIIKFHNKTEEEWEKNIGILKEIDFSNPETRTAMEKVSTFLFSFLNITTVIDSKNNLILTEEGNINSLHLLQVLADKTIEMIKNIKKAREFIAMNPVQ